MYESNERFLEQNECLKYVVEAIHIFKGCAIEGINVGIHLDIASDGMLLTIYELEIDGILFTFFDLSKALAVFDLFYGVEDANKTVLLITNQDGYRLGDVLDDLKVKLEKLGK